MYFKEIYPECVSAKPAMSTDECINGENKDPKWRNDDDEETDK